MKLLKKKIEEPKSNNYSFTSEVKEEIVEERTSEPVQETESGFTFSTKRLILPKLWKEETN